MIKNVAAMHIPKNKKIGGQFWLLQCYRIMGNRVIVAQQVAQWQMITYDTKVGWIISGR